MQDNPNPTVYPLTLYYDASCPMCHAEMHNLMRRNARELLVFVDVTAPGFDAQPLGASQQDLMTLIHARCADGTLVRGVDVFRLAYTAAGLPWVSALVSLPVVGPLTDALYPWVARFRNQIPRWLTRALFERATERAAHRAATQSAACQQGRCEL